MLGEKLNVIYDEFIKKAVSAGYSADELVLGEGCAEGGIVLIGEAPGKEETAAKRPFVGKAGKILNEFLEKTGIDRASLFVTNTVKFRPYKVSARGTLSNRPPTAAEIGLCSECLEKELKALEPRLIITLGNTPLKAVTGDKGITIGEAHGKITRTSFGELFAMYHPASLIYNRALTVTYEEDLKILSELI